MTRKAEALLRVGGSVRKLFHQLRALAEAAYDYEPGFTPAHRAVLESLATGGPATVPALARARPVARQHIQVLANELEALRLIETMENPAHKRSPLFRLTPAGKKRFDSMRLAEDRLLAELDLPFGERELVRLGTDLRKLSDALGKVLARSH